MEGYDTRYLIETGGRTHLSECMKAVFDKKISGCYRSRYEKITGLAKLQKMN